MFNKKKIQDQNKAIDNLQLEVDALIKDNFRLLIKSFRVGDWVYIDNDTKFDNQKKYYLTADYNNGQCYMAIDNDKGSSNSMDYSEFSVGVHISNLRTEKPKVCSCCGLTTNES